jgi:hypothetical protein
MVKINGNLFHLAPYKLIAQSVLGDEKRPETACFAWFPAFYLSKNSSHNLFDFQPPKPALLFGGKLVISSYSWVFGLVFEIGSGWVSLGTAKITQTNDLWVMSCNPRKLIMDPQTLEFEWPFNFQPNRTSRDTAVPYHLIILNTPYRQERIPGPSRRQQIF